MPRQHPFSLFPAFPVSAVGLAFGSAVAGGAFAQTTEQTLAPVVVSASKDTRPYTSSIGGFGEVPLISLPAAVSVITPQQIQDRQARNTSDLIKNDASLGENYNAVGYAEQFSLRGFALDNNANYRRDGLRISTDAAMPLENIERLDVLKGLAGFATGVAAPGVLNYVAKRPSNTPLRSVTVGASERGTLYSAVDLGGRFEDARFGYRINAAHENLRSYVKGADGERTMVSGAFDWRITPAAVLQLDFDWQKKSQISQPGYQLLDGVTVPQHVPADINFNHQPWSMPVKTETANVGVKFDYALNPQWQFSSAINRQSFKRDDYAAFPVGFTGNYDYSVYDYRSPNESKAPLSSQTTLAGKFATGLVQHALMFGVATYSTRDYASAYLYDLVGQSNVFNPVDVPPTALPTNPSMLARTQRETSFFVQDALAFSPQWTLHLGARHTTLNRHQFDTSGAQVNANNTSVTTPNIALVFSLQETMSFYGAYSQALEQGGIAAISGPAPNYLPVTNANLVLSPLKSKQLEFGAKFDLRNDFQFSSALFQIDKALEYYQDNGDGTATFVQNGRAVHTGLELALQGRITRNLSLAASVLALDPRQKTGDPSRAGQRTVNVPDLRANLSLDYALPQVSGLAVNGNWQYSSSKAVSGDNTISVGGYSLFNAGMKYATRIADTKTTLRFAVDNVFDKFAWRDVSELLGGYMFPVAPRTFRVSAQFDF